jgi:hypothetical protein
MQREGLKDAKFLALKTEEETISQGMKITSKAMK